MSAMNTTIDHDAIRAWVEARHGKPARATITGTDGRDHVLGIAYDDGAAGPVEIISWDLWFADFDRHGLAFLHQDETDEGGISLFSEIVERVGSEDHKHTGRWDGR